MADFMVAQSVGVGGKLNSLEVGSHKVNIFPKSRVPPLMYQNIWQKNNLMKKNFILTHTLSNQSTRVGSHGAGAWISWSHCISD